MLSRNRGLLNQFIRYFCVGGISALADWSLFYVLHLKIGYHYIAAAAGSFILSVIVNFFLGREFVFKNQCKFNASLEALSILAINTTGLLLDLLIIALAIELAHIDPMTAKIGATGLVFFWNFLLRRWWLYSC
ncbi:GtrA family protein|uniref:Putative flippase GtrA (Transmembrane translocase of bactoprenol-linked glucose) n=1 Tax=Dendrosporobacter quercicolus TaxID=146817 RepID=A0A1G9NN14_9FIRM|nr:GtrA family protein [Dendrosporobacter quercicolus]NSL47391.1 GtrA family protein [Dendrosporobacter quercicolus DSM 1736]SDL87779.1 Putative flippase GtrA (transmembrane translocase of bactoprenol-linked glucose) [Dendrosporobacter quercicolus]